MSWLALGASAVVQVIAAVVRSRGWWHVIRQARPAWCDLRYRDVALAQLGGMGWNAILPARAGDAVKIALVNRRLKDRRIAALASTLVPPALVEAAFTAILLVGLLAGGAMSLHAVKSVLPGPSAALIAGGALVVVLVAGFIFRRHLGKLVESVREGLSILAHPRILAVEVVPWQLAGRVLRLLAFALVLVAAGLPFGIAPALALMALQGATPSAGAAATAARIALLAAVLANVGAADVSAQHVAAVLAEAYGVTSVLNLAVSAAVIAWELRTASPKRILAYAKNQLQHARERSRRSKEPSAEEPYGPAVGRVPAPGPSTAAASAAPSTKASSLP
jgi:lysylphosphatidylglycerol synthase-like protein